MRMYRIVALVLALEDSQQPAQGIHSEMRFRSLAALMPIIARPVAALGKPKPQKTSRRECSRYLLSVAESASSVTKVEQRATKAHSSSLTSLGYAFPFMP